MTSQVTPRLLNGGDLMRDTDGCTTFSHADLRLSTLAAYIGVSLA